MEISSSESEVSDSSMDSSSDVSDSSLDSSPSLPKSGGSKRKSETKASNESTPPKMTKPDEISQNNETSRKSSPNSTSTNVTQNVSDNKNDHQWEVKEKDKVIHSIRRISVASVNKELSERSDGKEFEIIKQIMKVVNERLKNRPIKYVRLSETPPKKTTHVQENQIVEDRIENIPPKIINGFGLVAYYQKIPIVQGLLSVSNMGPEKNKVISNGNVILFFYKKGEIYASTSKNAWQPIQWCTDPDFPIKIANRLLNENGPIKETNRNPAGNNRQTTQCKKSEDGQSQNPYQSLTFRSEFTADFRKNCSIYGLNLNCFKKGGKDNGDIKDSIKVECGKAFVKIQAELTNLELTSILNHYSKILNDEVTYLHGSNIEEVSTEVYDKQLVEVSAEMNTLLDDKLYDTIQIAMQSNCMSQLVNFDFCHKHTNDYTIASQIYLHPGHSRERPESFNPKVKFSEIIERMLTWPEKKSSPNKRSSEKVNFADKALSSEKFKKEFQKFKISFEVKGKKKKRENVLNYVEGDLIYNEQVYWRINSKWCQVKSMYRLNKQFQNILIKHLPTGEEKESFQLPEVWTRKEENCKKGLDDEVKDYFKLFTSKRNDPNEDTFHIYDLKNLKFISDDEIQLDSAKNMYSILKIRKNGRIVFYYIQNGFSAIRDVSVKISKTLNKMFSVAQGRSDNNHKALNTMRLDYNKYFKLYRENLIDTGKNYSNKNFPTFSDFRRNLNTSSDFVFALIDPQGEGKLEKERDLRTELNLKDLENFLTINMDSNKSNFSQLKTDLMNFLQKKTEDELDIPETAVIIHAELTSNGFIKGNVVTNQLLVSTEKEFAVKCFKDCKVLQSCLFAYIKRHFQSAYHSILPKLELMEIRNVLTKFPMQFKICEISVE